MPNIISVCLHTIAIIIINIILYILRDHLDGYTRYSYTIKRSAPQILGYKLDQHTVYTCGHAKYNTKKSAPCPNGSIYTQDILRDYLHGQMAACSYIVQIKYQKN